MHDQLRFTIENYNIERLNKPTDARGVITTLIRTDISYSVLNNDSSMEAHIVPLKHSTRDLTVVVYHCPSDNITDDVVSNNRKLFNAYNRSAIIL